MGRGGGDSGGKGAYAVRRAVKILIEKGLVNGNMNIYINI